MKRRTIVLTLGGVIVVCTAFAARQYFAHVANTEIVGSEVPPTTQSDESKLPDFSDPRILDGYDHNVFVAKVLHEIGHDTVPPAHVPSTQYTARIILNIKGALKGTVIISEVDDVTPSVQVGSTYLIATRNSAVTGWYTFVGQDHYKLINDNPSLDDGELQTLAENDARVKQVEQAYPNEELLYGDIQHHTAYNAYNSRHYDALGNLIDDTVELAKTRPVLSPSTMPVNASDSSVARPSEASGEGATAPELPAMSSAASATPAPAASRDTPVVSAAASDSTSPTAMAVPTPSDSATPSPTVNSGSSVGSDSSASATSVSSPAPTASPSDGSGAAATPPPPPPSI